MPSTSMETASRRGDQGPVVDRSEDFDGYTANFVSFGEDLDATPLLKGLPDDRCQCPHWGYVIAGRLTCRIGDREEVYRTGDAFYLPPGHIPTGNEPGTEFLIWSPTHELRETEEAMARNMAALQAG